MGRTEDIKQIFQDKDTVKRVKEWINSRDEMNQASVAAATDSKLSLMEVLARLPVDEFEKMKQDLNLNFEGLPSKSPAAMAGGVSSGPQGGLDSHEVPPELNTGNEVQEESPHSTPVLQRQINSAPEGKSSDTQDQDNTLAEFKTEQLTDHNNKQGDKESCYLRLPAGNYCNNGNMDVMGGSEARDYPPNSLDQSVLRSRGTPNGSQHLSQVHVPTDSYRTTINAVTRGQTRSRHEAQYVLPGDSFNLSPYASDRHPVNGPQPVIYQQVARVPTGQNAPPPGSQTARPPFLSHNTIGALQGTNFQQSHMSHIPLESLNTIVSMLERESRRHDQPERTCNTCASFEAENKVLRKSNRCLGQQIEQLKWNFILLQQLIETLEETVIEKNQHIEENNRVIRHFHKIMVDRKKEIDKLMKELDVLRNKHKEERQKFCKVAVKEAEELAQLKEKMTKQTEMIEEAYVKKVGAESELRKQNDKTNVLLKENESLKEENRWLKEENASKAEINESELRKQNNKTSVLLKENESLKEENRRLKEELDASHAEINGLRLRLQAQEEKIKEREAINAFQEEFALREAQLKERIDDEIQKLMKVYEQLKIYAERHGLSLNLETERNYDDFPSP